MSTAVKDRRARPAGAHRRETDAAALSRLREALGWSRPQLARVMNCSDRALVNWERGELISAVYAARLRELQSVYDELKKLMKPQEIGRWLMTENEEFHGHSAADLIRRGESGQLWRSLFYLRTGMPE
jgi:transcriptional regulator with XRE-family HTH domain